MIMKDKAAVEEPFTADVQPTQSSSQIWAGLLLATSTMDLIISQGTEWGIRRLSYVVVGARRSVIWFWDCPGNKGGDEMSVPVYFPSKV